MKLYLSDIDGRTDLVITDIALVETAYVLTSVYGIEREVVVDHLIGLLRRENIRPHGFDVDRGVHHLPKGLAIEALRRCRPSNRISFADALIWAAARADGAAVFTLDERFPNEGIAILRSGLT